MSRNLPEVSPQSILFPYDEQEERFRCSFYEEGMSYNQVSKKNIEEFFTGLNQASPNYHEFKTYPKFVFPMMISALVGLLAGCFLIFLGRYYVSSWIIVVLGVICISGSIYLGFKTVTKFIDSQEVTLKQTRSQISEYISKNTDGFRNRGLQFKVPEGHFEYVELGLINSASVKNKSMFSERDTTVSDSRRNESIMDVTTNMSKPLLSLM